MQPPPKKPLNRSSSVLFLLRKHRRRNSLTDQGSKYPQGELIMQWSPNRRALIQAGGAALIIAAGAGKGIAQAIPASPESGAVKMGIEPWLGYGQWHIAAKKGLFKQAGLDERRDRQLHHRCRHQRRPRRRPASGRQHRHPHRDELHRRRAADQDRGAARCLEDRRCDDLRRLGHRRSRTSRASRSPTRRGRPATSSSTMPSARTA